MISRFKNVSHLEYALWGSTLFELIITLHRIALFALLAPKAYGYLVSILSIIHLGNHIADFGASNSIAAFLGDFLKSKKNFLYLFFRLTVIPHLPLVLVTSYAVAFFTSTLFSKTMIVDHQGLVMSLVIAESIRGFLRQFLYTLQKTAPTVNIELCLLMMRIATIWFLYNLCNWPITVTMILYSHVLELSIMILLFGVMLHRVYLALPNLELELPANITQQTIFNRFFNYLLRLSRNIFSTNFLTPLFAVHYGLECAGVFYFAGKISKALLNVVKITIGYAGNGMLANAHQSVTKKKALVFAHLQNTLLGLVLPVVLFFIINFGLLAYVSTASMAAYKPFLLSVLFLLLSISEGFFILYEGVFIIHRAAHKLFFIKIGELAVFYVLLHFIHLLSPAMLLASVIGIRVCSLALVRHKAREQWLMDAPVATMVPLFFRTCLVSAFLYGCVYFIT